MTEESEPEKTKSEVIAELREKVVKLETENEILRAGQSSRRPLIDAGGMVAFGLIACGIILTIWSTLDPEVAFSGIAGLLAGGGLVAAGKFT